MRRFGVAVLVLAFMLGVQAAEARSSHNPAATAHPGEFDYYVLALSWSPEFCATPDGQRTDKAEQCGELLGFVVHGLWPQFDNGRWPENCDPGAPRTVPEDVADIVLHAEPPMPPGDPSLLTHEWLKHGTCSGLNQLEYFGKIREAVEKVRIPEALKRPVDPLTLDFDGIVREFAGANPGLRADMMDVSDDGSGNVKEIRICFSKDLEFQACTGSKNRDRGGRFLPVVP